MSDIVKREESLPVEINGGEVVHKEEQASGDPKTLENQFITQTQTAGTLDITDEQYAILTAPLTEEDISSIQIRADGLIYLPWYWYQKRLNAAFRNKWSLVPFKLPAYNAANQEVLWFGYLIAGGVFVDSATGGQIYKPNNPTMNYSDAIEGAKSNALMRCCKRLSMGLELWDKDFIADWTSKYAYKKLGASGREEWCKNRGKFDKKEPVVVPQKGKSETPKEDLIDGVDYIAKLKEAIGDDPDHLYILTSFKGKDKNTGEIKQVEGKRDFSKLSQKQAQVAYGKWERSMQKATNVKHEEEE